MEPGIESGVIHAKHILYRSKPFDVFLGSPFVNVYSLNNNYFKMNTYPV